MDCFMGFATSIMEGLAFRAKRPSTICLATPSGSKMMLHARVDLGHDRIAFGIGHAAPAPDLVQTAGTAAAKVGFAIDFAQLYARRLDAHEGSGLMERGVSAQKEGDWVCL
ncbi:hypothetical protein SAMN04515647_3283 [Cohaesibacter sp. ES.047]|nr:hypothetical protein SAMN04515647_3283 [Cohaesibacter sp. ES.047]